MALIFIYFMSSFLPMQHSGTCLDDMRASRHPLIAIPVSAFVFQA
jgi:hypothetical protein